MSIKPVDFQVMLPKTPEVSRINNEEQHRNLALQQQQTSSMQHKVESDLRQVHSQDKAQNAMIREKQERGSKKEEKKKNKNYGKKTEDDNEGTKIDIRL